MSKSEETCPVHETKPNSETFESATFAVGWFWTPDDAMSRVKGVLDTRVGYTGGKKSSGVAYRSMGDHTEALQVDFDPRVISYETILSHFFSQHNPHAKKSSVQYRNALWYHDETQKKKAEAAIAALEKARGRKVLTPLESLKTFYMAEEYHQHYNQKARSGRGRY